MHFDPELAGENSPTVRVSNVDPAAGFSVLKKPEIEVEIEVVTPPAPPAAEAHEQRVYMRDARRIVAGWLDKDEEEIHAFEKGGRCFLDYPDPDNYGGRLHVTGRSWWHVLRMLMADLIRCGILEAPKPDEEPKS